MNYGVLIYPPCPMGHGGGYIFIKKELRLILENK